MLHDGDARRVRVSGMGLCNSNDGGDESNEGEGRVRRVGYEGVLLEDSRQWVADEVVEEEERMMSKNEEVEYQE